MFKFLYRSRKPAKSHTTPACLDDVRTWKVTGNSTFLQKALNAGFDTRTSVDDKLGNLLHVAAHQSYLESLFVLHAKGMRDVVKNPQEYYAVHLAAAAGFRDGLLYILKNMGADIDARSGQGATPLMLAVENGHLDVASALLARGARVGRPAVSLGNGSGDGSIAVIHLCKSPGMLRLLLTTTTLHVDTRSAEGMTLLHACSAAGDTATAAECLALGANCKAVDHNHANALHHACRNRSANIIPLLIKAGCSSSEPDARGFTPVEVALLRHDCDTAYSLYCAGALFTKRQLLLLAILLRHSSLLKAIRSERDLSGPDCFSNRSGSQTALDESASKVETQAAALLAGPPETNLNRNASTFSLSSLVVSVGQVPTANDVNAENFSSIFQHIHDPVPRPVGTSSSKVLVSVYSRFLRHSDSSVSGAHAAWRSGARTQALTAVPQQSAVRGLSNDADFSDPAGEQPVLAHRHSESMVVSHPTKNGFWTSTAGNPTGGHVAMRLPKRLHNDANADAERREAADKLNGADAAGGRSSLERLLPHYLQGLQPFRIHAPQQDASQASSSPSVSPSNGKSKGSPAAAPAPAPAPASKAKASPLPSALAGASAPLHAQTPSLQAQAQSGYPSASSHAIHTGEPSSMPITDARVPPPASVPAHAMHAQPSTSSGGGGSSSAVLPPPQTVSGDRHTAAAAPVEHVPFALSRRPPRRSFCGEPPPEALAFSEGTRKSSAHTGDMDQLMQDHRSRNIRKSAFFSRGRTTPNDPSNLITRRSQTFDWGYRHSEMIGVPVSRGRWGQPQALPGPGGARGNPNTQTESSSASQDDTALMRDNAELPSYGQDLAGDGMLEFEEMMARRVQLFHGGSPVRRGGDDSKPSRHIDSRTVAGLQHVQSCSALQDTGPAMDEQRQITPVP